MPYKRKECGTVFDEPEIITTTHNSRYEAHGYEEYGKCPNCPSDEFYECIYCDYCGEAVAENKDAYVHFADKEVNICNDCLRDYCEENYSYNLKHSLEAFPRRLAELRRKRNMLQSELADDLFTTQSKISHYETGRQNPSIGCFVELANYFGVSTDYLLGG